jgi:hypothetical protein
MACACKSSSSSRQVTAVKQVVKKTSTPKLSSNRPQKTITPRRIVFRRPM